MVQPFFRSFDRWWVVKIPVGNGVRETKKLAKGKENKDAAFTAFYKLMAERGQPVVAQPVLHAATVCDKFQDHVNREKKPATAAWYHRFLQDFLAFNGYGLLVVDALKPCHVTEWLDSHKGWNGCRRGAVVAVKSAFSWAAKERLIADNPLSGVPTPPKRRRKRTLTETEKRELIGAIRKGDTTFIEFVTVMLETGARPGELREVKARHVNLTLSLITFEDDHKTISQTDGKPRVIYLNQAAREIIARRVAKYPTGPLFRGWRGKAYTRNGLRCRFRRLRKKLPHLAGVTAYTARHTFATDALANGVPVAVVAELMGHQDLKMLSEHYAHLGERRETMLKFAAQATGSSSGAAAPGPNGAVTANGQAAPAAAPPPSCETVPGTRAGRPR